MESMVIFFWYALVMGSAAQNCSEVSVDACVESLSSSLSGNTTDMDVCRAMKTFINCLQIVVDDCAVRIDDDVTKGLTELEHFLKDNCASDSDDKDEEKQCDEVNEDYIFECIDEGFTQAFTLWLEQSNKLDENDLQCVSYRLMAQCFVERVGEICGDEAARVVKEELDDLPQEIAEICKGSDDKEKMKQCFEANEDYTFECIYEVSSHALTQWLENSDTLDENYLQCASYSMMAQCFVEKIDEKCGDKAAQFVKKEMDDLPTEIAQACEASHALSIIHLDKKKK